MEIKIALAGNPNCGKTTLFNSLTGSNQYVGNWPGVTVEKKEGRLKGDKNVVIQDLPGVYSLSPYTPEEAVARGYLINERPDAILNIVDGVNIERNLYLTTQLAELGLPMVVAVNMMDLVRKNGGQIDLKKLSQSLGCVVVETSALKGEGCVEAARQAAELARSRQSAEPLPIFSDSVEQTLTYIEEAIGGLVNPRYLRWYAVKFFERDPQTLEDLALDEELKNRLEQSIAHCEQELDDDAESIVANQRYSYISGVVGKSIKKQTAKHSLSPSDRIDRIVTNRLLALPIFASVMFLVYYIAIGTVGTWFTDWTNDVLFGELIPPAVESWMTGLGCADWLVGLVVNGIIGGVGSVLGFVPQMLVLFLMLSILEDIGYMARVAFIMDRVFRKFGLSGKSFIPMLIGSGCGVPGVMASRTIENERDRRMTIMTTCFVPCGAKMPIIGLFAGALFGGSGLIAVSAYFAGAAAVVLSGVTLKKTKAFAGDPAPFVMELPPYHAPSADNVLRATWERGWSFIKRAGSVILASSVVLWFLQGFGFVNGAFGMVEDNNSSLLAAVGSGAAFLFQPLGFGDWQSAVATATGLIAKENVVSTFGVLFHLGEGVAQDAPDLLTAVALHYTPLSAYSFLLFNLLCAPCFAAMGAIKREMNSTKWTLAAIGYMCGFAYVASLIVYQLGGLFTGETTLGLGVAAALACLAGLICLVFRRNKYDGGRQTVRAASAASPAGSR